MEPAVTKVNAMTLRSGEMALAFNDVPGGTRRHLRFAVTPDDGHKWTRLAELENFKAGLHFSYPTMRQDGCLAYVAYSSTRHGNAAPIPTSGVKLGVINLGEKYGREGPGPHALAPWEPRAAPPMPVPAPERARSPSAAARAAAAAAGKGKGRGSTATRGAPTPARSRQAGRG